MSAPPQRGERALFFSTGEASGDMLAAALTVAIRERDPLLRFYGIGSERMAAAGVRLTNETAGWASMGPLSALGKIPGLLAVALRHAFGLRLRRPALIVLIDFGAFNLRLATVLRALRYRGPILYVMPPGAWLDRPASARAVARLTSPLTAFAHQRDFYRSLGLEIAFFGHPVASLIAPRAARAPAPPAGGVAALLPGSRRGEIRYHLPRLLAATARLREHRPQLEVVVSAADADAEELIGRLAPGLRTVRGARAAFDGADVALIASGTAVLEAALRAVPCVAMYVVSEAQAKIGRRMYRGRYVTLPNIILGREAIPELLQEAATPEALAAAAEALLREPGEQLAALAALRERLGPGDALERIASYALELATRQP